MLIMVIAKPMLFTMVNEVPFDWAGAFWATRVENRGESAITAMLHINRNINNRVFEGFKSINGDIRQHNPDMVSAMEATFLAPNLCDTRPLNTQAKLPAAMIRKESRGTLILACG